MTDLLLRQADPLIPAPIPRASIPAEGLCDDADIYLDYAATTPVDPGVVRVMNDFLTADGVFGNPASVTHSFGRAAAEAVENARREVAALMSAEAEEIVWTSGATEAINLAMKGSALARKDRGAHIVTSALEHKAVLDTAAWLEAQGFDVDRIRPDGDGTVTAESLAEVLRPDTVLVSLMHVNNEIGTVTDIAELGSLAARSAVSRGGGAERCAASSRRYRRCSRSRSARTRCTGRRESARSAFAEASPPNCCL